MQNNIIMVFVDEIHYELYNRKSVLFNIIYIKFKIESEMTSMNESTQKNKETVIPKGLKKK